MMRSTVAMILIPLLYACGGARKELAEAAVSMEAGRMEQALAAYGSVLQRKPGWGEAASGRQQAAQGHFAALQLKAMDAYAMNDLAMGETRRQEAHLFRMRMLDSDVILAWDPNLEGLRGQARRNRASVLYAEAEQAMREDRFSDAERLAGECQQLDPDRREAGYLLQLARTEPRYREARKAMDLGLWREAYTALAGITERDAAYKDALQLQEQCRVNASYTLACSAMGGRNEEQRSLGIRLAQRMKATLLAQPDPFLVLVDRDDTDILLDEQRRQMSPLFDEETAVEAGRLLGARYMVTARADQGTDGLIAHLQLLDTGTGRVHVAGSLTLSRQELMRGATTETLLEQFTRAFAMRITAFDPSMN
jgi:tetratricopeptide (TPR) repeat protein